VRQGDAAEQVISLAHEAAVDLVVIGVHARLAALVRTTGASRIPWCRA
jgi:hypothetical protein